MAVPQKTFVVNAFNRYFVELGPSLAKQIPPSKNDCISNCFPSIKDSPAITPTDSYEISNIISGIKKTARHVV